MKCAKCGMELGQKNICPVCSGQKMETANQEPLTVDVAVSDGKMELQLSEKSKIPAEESVRIKFQQFLDANCDNWEAAFEREFADRDFDFYQNAYVAVKSLWEVRCFLVEAIHTTDAEKVTPPFKIQVMKQLQEKFPDYPVNPAIQWLQELFKTNQDRKKEFEKFARSFNKPIPAELGEMLYVSPAKLVVENESTGDGDADEKSEARDLSLDAPVWLQAIPVSSDAWNKIMQEKRNTGARVSWNDAIAFCRKLTAYSRSRKLIPHGYAYTLPDRKVYEFIAVRGGLSFGSIYSSEWLWGEDGKDYKPIVQNLTARNQKFDELHRDTRYDTLGFRVMLAPQRTGEVCDVEEEPDPANSSGGAGYGQNLV